MASINIPMQQKRSSVPGRAPSVADIEPGQLAVNLADRKLFTKDETNNVITLGTVSDDLATVAFSGSYNDLLNLPNIPAPYVLPAATTAALGGIIAGAGLSVATNGTLSAAVQSVRGSEGSAQIGAVVLTRADLGLDILDANSKILPQYLPDSITGAMVYIGTWDADTNTPAIPAAEAANLGWLYVVSVPGTTEIDGNANWGIGDWLISDGAVWQRVAAVNTTVVSVNGQTGAVVINASNLPGLAAVGRTGSYNDLLEVPSAFPPAPHNQSIDTITDAAVVAKTGSYNDLLDLPPNPTFTDIGVSISGNPIVYAENYVFTRAMQFEQNFAGSQAYAEMMTGTTAQVRILKSEAATPGTFTEVGGLTYNTSTRVATFSTINPAPISFAPGDILRYEWVSSGIRTISITLRATRI